ncbi:hypothetical protein T484DRAFT_1799114 [Baffinella frigidus]|nr:hypothetical protein T484DRAFT_1799114 [Cryptophyta sp. CCMP2293]
MPFGGFAVLVGASRKSFIGKVIGEPDASSIRRAWGTAAACTAAEEQDAHLVRVNNVEQGAHLVRVHDVREMKDAVAIADAIYPKP